MAEVWRFLEMGGYAGYVWGSYGVVAVVLVQQFCAPLVRRRRLLRELARELAGGDQPADHAPRQPDRGAPA